MQIYLAGSIFYYGDVLRNTEWAAKIRAALPNIDLYSPIENTDINGTEGKKKSAGSIMIVDADNARLKNTDVLIACLDGDLIPSGTCAEIGYMGALIENGAEKLIIGICTDNRQCFLTHSEEKDLAGASSLGEQQYSYQNLYVTGLIKKYGQLVSNIDDAIKILQEYADYRNRIERNSVIGTNPYEGAEIDWSAFSNSVYCWDDVNSDKADPVCLHGVIGEEN